MGGGIDTEGRMIPLVRFGSSNARRERVVFGWDAFCNFVLRGLIFLLGVLQKMKKALEVPITFHSMTL